MSHKIAAVANEVSKSTTNVNAKNEVLENQPVAPANEVSKPEATEKPKTQRVLESRSDWERIFTHTLTLVATVAKGEALEANCRKGFGFLALVDGVNPAPHAKGYAQSLLAGFASKKADKFLDKTPLAEQEKRTDIALKVLMATKLGSSNLAKAKSILKAAKPKQEKTFAESLKAILG